MSLRPVSTNRKADADRRLLENNSMASMIDGSDSVRLTDETESLAVTSDGATPNYSKRPSCKFEFCHFSSV